MGSTSRYAGLNAGADATAAPQGRGLKARVIPLSPPGLIRLRIFLSHEERGHENPRMGSTSRHAGLNAGADATAAPQGRGLQGPSHPSLCQIGQFSAMSDSGNPVSPGLGPARLNPVNPVRSGRKQRQRDFGALRIRPARVALSSFCFSPAVFA